MWSKNLVLLENIPPHVGHATTLSCVWVLKWSQSLCFPLNTPKQSKSNKQKKSCIWLLYSLLHRNRKGYNILMSYCYIFRNTLKKLLLGKTKLSDWYYYNWQVTFNPRNTHSNVSNQNSLRHVDQVCLKKSSVLLNQQRACSYTFHPHVSKSLTPHVCSYSKI